MIQWLLINILTYLLAYTDLVLLDIKHMDNAKHINLTAKLIHLYKVTQNDNDIKTYYLNSREQNHLNYFDFVLCSFYNV